MPMIVGIVFGSLLGAVLLASLFFFLVRRARRLRQHETVTFYREKMVRQEISNPILVKRESSVIEFDFPERSPSILGQDVNRHLNFGCV